MTLLFIIPLLLSLLPGLSRSASAAVSEAPFSGRWIDVDLFGRHANAMEGDTVVYTAGITSGKAGFETPTGTFYVQYRVDRETMNSETLGVPRDAPEGYFLENIRYVQYILGDGTALHGNYWAADWVFGNADTSHGCVSMREADAGFFWRFAGVGTPVVIHRNGARNVAVESQIGKPVAQAKSSLEALGFKVEVSEEYSSEVVAGNIVSQKPAAGASAARGSTVTLRVSKGATMPTVAPTSTVAPTPTAPAVPTPKPIRAPEGDNAWVPEVIGLSESEARARIEQAGLQPGYTNYQVEADIPTALHEFFNGTAPGSVLSSQPLANEKVQKGTVVKLAVRKP